MTTNLNSLPKKLAMTQISTALSRPRRIFLTNALPVLLMLLLTFGHAVQAAEVSPEKGKELSAARCASCHQTDGNSTDPANPILSSQHSGYLERQIKAFQSRNGNAPQRTNAIMNAMVVGLSDQDIADLSAWFSEQPRKPAAAKDARLVEIGQKLWRSGDFRKGIPSCGGCHGPAGHGIPQEFPRLNGQYAAYTEAQLKAFRARQRANDPNAMMQTIAGKLSDDQIKAIADFTAGLR